MNKWTLPGVILALLAIAMYLASSPPTEFLVTIGGVDVTLVMVTILAIFVSMLFVFLIFCAYIARSR